MAFKLAIDNRVCVTVKGKLAGASRGSFMQLNFTLDMDRVTQEGFAEGLRQAANTSAEAVDDYLVSRIRGWDNQRLVLNEDGSPAQFSEEAMRELLKVPGMTGWILAAYSRDLGVQEKNA